MENSIEEVRTVGNRIVGPVFNTGHLTKRIAYQKKVNTIMNTTEFTPRWCAISES